MSQDSREGTTLGPYRIERVLGRGGMGVVYLALDPRLDRRIALKVLAPELSRDPGFRERFVREARMAAATDHANIIPIYEAGEVEGIFYLAMRYVDGTDLEEVLEQHGSLPPQQVVNILTQVADALDAAHERGLVHRDVKPGNVMLASGRGREDWGHVYLTDFGLTKRTAGQTRLTATGAFIGTIAYVAPEQIQGHEVDGRTDQYSLACMAYECLTGQEPFRRPTDVASLMAHLSDPPPSASSEREGIPQAVDPVLARGMAKSPEDRFPDCAAFVAALAEAVREATTGPAMTASPTEPSLTPPMMPAPGPAGQPETAPPPASEPTVLSQSPAQSEPTVLSRSAPPSPPATEPPAVSPGPAAPPPPAPSAGAGRAPSAPSAPPQQPVPYAPPERPGKWPGQEPAKPGGGRRRLGLIAAAVVVLAGAGVGVALLIGGGGGKGGGGGNGGGPTLTGKTCPGLPTVKGVPADGEDIFLMSADGSGQERVIGQGGGVSWFPDCRHLAFTSGSEGGSQIIEAGINGADRHAITSGGDVSSQVDVSPDGKQIVYAVIRSGAPRDLFVQGVDGKGKQRLPTDQGLAQPAQDIFPVWSPDGTQIAFASNRDGDMDIWVIASDGSGGPERVVDDPGSATEPAWSPDGTRIAYSTTTGAKPGSHQIFVVTVATKAMQQVTHDDFSNAQPDWSNNRTIVYASNHSGNYDIFQIAASGTGSPRPLTTSSVNEKKPAVSPDGTLIAYSAGPALKP